MLALIAMVALDVSEGAMITIRFLVASALLASAIALAHAHGGGCRKSSPPGQCCHMDNKAGRVHCH